MLESWALTEVLTLSLHFLTFKMGIIVSTS